MAKSRPPKRILESYTIKGSDKVIKPGDCVLMRASDASKPPYVARVEAIEAAGSRGTNVRVRVRWYYRPEESIGGRRPFHGSKEVFLSDHYDVQSADTIEGKCNVHSFRSYTKLDSVNAEDFFCRFEYKSATGSFVPDRIAVFCKCEMPYNPDDLMIQCEECSDWFHPACIGMTIKEAKKLEHFFCQTCTAENGKMVENSHEATAQSEEKPVESKRRRRLLRVLSLRHCHIQKIPDNVSNLFNLHYLDLGYTLLKEIPRSIAKLSNLQTLYLKGSVLELPSEVTMLTKLQHLIIDVGRFGSSASNKICRQEHLQTLKYIEANSCVVRNLGCLTRMRSLGIRKVLDSYNTDLWTSVSNMKTLASLSVITADRDRDILDLSDLKPLPYLEKLMLSGRLDKGAIPPPFGHFPKLKSLRLCFSGLHEDPLALLAVMFQNLGHLNLYRCYDGTRLTFRARWFPMLKHLYLSSMGELKVVEIEDGTLRTLRRLELWGLKSLTSVPEGLVHLKSLQQLCIGSMMPEEFKTRLEGRDRWIVEHIPYIGDP